MNKFTKTEIRNLHRIVDAISELRKLKKEFFYYEQFKTEKEASKFLQTLKKNDPNLHGQMLYEKGYWYVGWDPAEEEMYIGYAR